MSQIDEAFIQAYAPPSAVSTAPTANPISGQLPSQVATGLHRGPHLPTQPPAQDSALAQPSTWAPEPVPAPHFRMTPEPQQVKVAASAAAVAAPATERRPLSTFSTPEPPPTTAFHPVFEVDAFRWPETTNQLLNAHHQLLIPVAEQLLDASEQGRSLVGIAGTRPHVGCSTVLMCLARLLASAGKSVALVDANFTKAALARDLGLEFDTGWEAALIGNLPLAECVVNSLEENMALLPLARPTDAANELLASIHTSVTAGVLRYHYDVVLFNLGAAGVSPQYGATHSIVEHCRLDASIIVADTEANANADTHQIDPLLALFGATCLGVIGNTAA